MPLQEQELSERVRSLAEPVLERHEAELVDLFVRRGKMWLVRLVADKEGGIDLETCARINEQLGRLLDADDPIPGRYTLEVTSPGADRPLRTATDFRKNLGRKVRIVLAQGQHEGTLEEVGDDRVTVSTPKGTEQVALGDIVKAKVVLPW